MAYRIIAITFMLIILFPLRSLGSSTNGTIDAVNKFAWSANAGWINVNPTNGNVRITDAGMTGYTWDGVFGWMNVAPTNGGVANDGEGHLSGYAWSAGAGWVNFSGVTINSAGQFHGSATGATMGTINFDCANCLVTTDWRPVSARNPSVTATPIPSVSANVTGAVPGSNGAFVGLSSVPFQTWALGGPVGTIPPGLPPPHIPVGQPTSAACTYPLFSIGNPDITGDGTVDVFDFNQLMVQWNRAGANSADINHDCTVDILDFNQLMVAWS